LEAVEAKLKRQPTMKLSGMNDIAGCRAIVPCTVGIKQVAHFVETCKQGWKDHELKDIDDYIEKPRSSGYRGIHLIYRFKSNNDSFDRRLIEVQVRSGLQHAWATAVEIVDLFTSQSLKAADGDPNWLRFFALMGSAIAKLENAENGGLVPGTPIGQFDKELQEELRHYTELLHVDSQMRAFGSLTNSIAPTSTTDGSAYFNYTGVSGYSGYSGESGYFVMEIEPGLKRIQIRGYKKDEIQLATRDVALAEQANPNTVLVAASDLIKLKEAYPNWIIDTTSFLSALELTLNPYRYL
jgi:hypothetical protein